MKEDLKICTNETCNAFNKIATNYKFTFDIPFNLTDATGTISRVRASSKCVEKLLEVKVLLTFLNLIYSLFNF